MRRSRLHPAPRKRSSTRELESLAREADRSLRRLRTENRELRTALLINSRTDVALAVGADGVHLRSDDISPKHVRAIWKSLAAADPVRARALVPAKLTTAPLIAVSCHTPEEVDQAAAERRQLRRLRPGVRKRRRAAAGLDALREPAAPRSQCSLSEESHWKTPDPASKPEPPASPASACSRKTTSQN